jgi:hypothetical protein
MQSVNKLPGQHGWSQVAVGLNGAPPFDNDEAHVATLEAKERLQIMLAASQTHLPSTMFRPSTLHLSASPTLQGIWFRAPHNSHVLVVEQARPPLLQALGPLQHAQ